MDSISDTAHFALAETENVVDPRAPLAWSDYALLAEIGSGAMGTIFRARQKSLSKLVAVKVLKEQWVDGPEARERFLREARAVAQLRHPHAVDVHGIGRSPDGGYFLVMDLIEGMDLSKRLRCGLLPVGEAVRITKEVATAVEQAHRVGIIHRDIKPSNVLLDHTGRALVTDFGLAKALCSDEPALSCPGQVAGTPQYLAPEQIDSRLGVVGPATDVYGVGALLYVLLCGRAPINGETTVEVLAKIASGATAVPIRELRPETPTAVAQVCMKCLEKHPRRRFAGAWAVRQALEGATGRRDERPAKLHDLWNVLLGGRSRGICVALSTVLGGLLLVGLVAGGWYAMRGGRGAGHTPPTIDVDEQMAADVQVDWDVKIFNKRAQNEPGQPATYLESGDKIRLSFRFSRAIYPYVAWIGSQGSIKFLHPNPPTEAAPHRQVDLPLRPETGFPVQGPPGTEVCLLLLRDTPLEDPAGWAESADPGQPFPPLTTNRWLWDDQPVDPVTLRTDTTTSPDRSAYTLQRLPPDAASRGLGSPETLPNSSALIELGRWFSKLKQRGRIHYMAIPHRPRSSSNGRNGGAATH